MAKLSNYTLKDNDFKKSRKSIKSQFSMAILLNCIEMLLCSEQKVLGTAETVFIITAGIYVFFQHTFAIP